jgi:hypothetical protein
VTDGEDALVDTMQPSARDSCLRRPPLDAELLQLPQSDQPVLTARNPRNPPIPPPPPILSTGRFVVSGLPNRPVGGHQGTVAEKGALVMRTE